MAYAPSAIRSAATAITGSIGGAVFSGVVGDAAHLYGYHLARNQLPATDYSVQLAEDRDGNGDAASALDISLPPAQMVAVTARLRAAAERGDPRLYALREFAGTLDGRTTYNHDLATGGEGFGQWDDSHLWHVHLSGYRRYADDPAAWAAIADVFTDSADIGGQLGDDMPTADEVAAAVWNYGITRGGLGPAPALIWLADARIAAGEAKDAARDDPWMHAMPGASDGAYKGAPAFIFLTDTRRILDRVLDLLIAGNTVDQATLDGIKALQVGTADVDEAALAASLLPLLAANVGRLTDEDAAKLAKAVNDDAAERMTAK